MEHIAAAIEQEGPPVRVLFTSAGLIPNCESVLDMDMEAHVHALGELPTPEDIAEAVAFLCSDSARAITGVTLPVDSGWLAAVSYKTYAGGVPWGED